MKLGSKEVLSFIQLTKIENNGFRVRFFQKHYLYKLTSNSEGINLAQDLIFKYMAVNNSVFGYEVFKVSNPSLFKENGKRDTSSPIKFLTTTPQVNGRLLKKVCIKYNIIVTVQCGSMRTQNINTSIAMLPPPCLETKILTFTDCKNVWINEDTGFEETTPGGGSGTPTNPTNPDLEVNCDPETILDLSQPMPYCPPQEVNELLPIPYSPLQEFFDSLTPEQKEFWKSKDISKAILVQDLAEFLEAGKYSTAFIDITKWGIDQAISNYNFSPPITGAESLFTNISRAFDWTSVGDDNTSYIDNFPNMEPTFHFELDDEMKYALFYPKFYSIVKNIKTFAINRPKVMAALHNLTGLSKQQILEYLSFGSGPKIKLEKLINAWGVFRPEKSANTLFISLSDVVKLENSNSESYQNALAFILSVSILHEFTHYGTNLNRLSIGGFELGDVFEKASFNMIISDIPTAEKYLAFIKY